jgi:hypothetical protein
MEADLVKKIATLMKAQADAYAGLESLTNQLIAALTRSEPINIDSLSRAGESELFSMRSRLLEITTALSAFAECRAGNTGSLPLDAHARQQFEESANKLLKTARNFENIIRRASSLAIGGSSFAAASIQMCGVPPSTYRAPLMRYAGGSTR